MTQPPGAPGGQIYWAPPPPDLQYGGPAYQPPGAPPPPYGSGPTGGSGGPGGGGSNRAVLTIVAAAVVVAAVAVVAFAISQGRNRTVDGAGVALTASTAANPTKAPTGSGLTGPSSPSGPSTSSSAGSGSSAGSSDPDSPPRPTGTTAPPDGPSAADAKVVATRYFADLNAKDPADARTLLCDDAKSDFDTTAKDPDSDFTFTWSQITYVGVGAVDSDVTVLTYDTTLSRGSMSDQIKILLYFINEDGVKLCGEDTE